MKVILGISEDSHRDPIHKVFMLAHSAAAQLWAEQEVDELSGGRRRVEDKLADHHEYQEEGFTFYKVIGAEEVRSVTLQELEVEEARRIRPFDFVETVHKVTNSNLEQCRLFGRVGSVQFTSEEMKCLREMERLVREDERLRLLRST